jgi:hypothetical protein
MHYNVFFLTLSEMFGIDIMSVNFLNLFQFHVNGGLGLPGLLL